MDIFSWEDIFYFDVKICAVRWYYYWLEYSYETNIMWNEHFNFMLSRINILKNIAF